MLRFEMVSFCVIACSLEKSGLNLLPPRHAYRRRAFIASANYTTFQRLHRNTYISLIVCGVVCMLYLDRRGSSEDVPFVHGWRSALRGQCSALVLKLGLFGRFAIHF